MSYDEVEIEDMTWNEELQVFQYACPCGDLFQISKVRKVPVLRR
jgi:diphthamide biosynthesis protein 3